MMIHLKRFPSIFIPYSYDLQLEKLGPNVVVQKVLVVTGGNDCVKSGPRPKGHIHHSIVDHMRNAIRYWTDRHAMVRVVFSGTVHFGARASTLTLQKTCTSNALIIACILSRMR